MNWGFYRITVQYTIIDRNMQVHKTHHGKHFRHAKKWLYGKVIILVLVVIAAFALNGTWEVYKKAKLARESRNEIQTELTKLTDRKNALTHDTELLKTDRGVEETMRQKFGVVKEGEEVVVVVDPIDGGDAGKTKPQGLWGWFKSLF